MYAAKMPTPMELEAGFGEMRRDSRKYEER